MKRLLTIALAAIILHAGSLEPVQASKVDPNQGFNICSVTNGKKRCGPIFVGPGCTPKRVWHTGTDSCR